MSENTKTPENQEPVNCIRNLRRKILYISQERVFNLLINSKPHIWVAFPQYNIPEDSKLLHVWFDTSRLAFGFMLQHDSFPVTLECERPPEFIGVDFEFIDYYKKYKIDQLVEKAMNAGQLLAATMIKEHFNA